MSSGPHPGHTQLSVSLREDRHGSASSPLLSLLHWGRVLGVPWAAWSGVALGSFGPGPG